MTPAEWKDLPDWERNLLVRGLNAELTGNAGTGELRGGGDGDGSLNNVPESLRRLMN